MLVLAVNAGYVLLLHMTMNQYATLSFGAANRAEGYIVPVWLSSLFRLEMSAASSWLVLRWGLRRMQRRGAERQGPDAYK